MEMRRKIKIDLKNVPLYGAVNPWSCRVQNEAEAENKLINLDVFITMVDVLLTPYWNIKIQILII